jgi:lipoprotein NlpI
LYALSAYIVKFIVPLRLSALYPFPGSPGSGLPLLYYLSPVFLLVLGFFVYRSARYTRAIVFGSLFFVVNIMFLLQIVSVGTAFMADRFSYIPYLGFVFIAAWAVEKAVTGKKQVTDKLAWAIPVVALLFIFLTFERCKVWFDGETLWTDVIEKYPDESSRPYSNRSVIYNERGQWDKTIADCTKAVAIDPNDAYAYSNRGVAFANVGEFDRAMSDCSRAIGINPKFANAWSNRGNVWFGLKEWNKAIDDYSGAIAIDPGDANAWANRGVAWSNLGNIDKGLEGLSQAIALDPGNAKAYSNRGSLYVNLREYNKALADYTSAIGIDQGYANAYFNRGTVYGDLGNWDKSVADFTRAIEINPDFQMAYKSRDVAYRNLLQSK